MSDELKVAAAAYDTAAAAYDAAADAAAKKSVAAAAANVAVAAVKKAGIFSLLDNSREDAQAWAFAAGAVRDAALASDAWAKAEAAAEAAATVYDAKKNAVKVHLFSSKQLESWIGSDHISKESLLNILLDIINLRYDVKTFRTDVQNYCDQ